MPCQWAISQWTAPYPAGRFSNNPDAILAEIDLQDGKVLRTVTVGTGCETLAYFLTSAGRWPDACARSASGHADQTVTPGIVLSSGFGKPSAL